MNPLVYDRLKREEKIEKILNKEAALTALLRERRLEKFAAQLQREELVEQQTVEIYPQLACSWYIKGLDFCAPHWRNHYGSRRRY